MKNFDDEGDALMLFWYSRLRADRPWWVNTKVAEDDGRNLEGGNIGDAQDATGEIIVRYSINGVDANIAQVIEAWSKYHSNLNSLNPAQRDELKKARIVENE